MEKLTHGLDIMARGSGLGQVVPRVITDGNWEILDMKCGALEGEGGDNRETRGSEGGVRDLGPRAPREDGSFEF